MAPRRKAAAPARPGQRQLFPESLQDQRQLTMRVLVPAETARTIAAEQARRDRRERPTGRDDDLYAMIGGSLQDARARSRNPRRRTAARKPRRRNGSKMNRVFDAVQSAPPGQRLATARAFSRATLIAALQQNDRNGVYTDSAAKAEGFPPLTRDEAGLLVLEQLGYAPKSNPRRRRRRKSSKAACNCGPVANKRKRAANPHKKRVHVVIQLTNGEWSGWNLSPARRLALLAKARKIAKQHNGAAHVTAPDGHRLATVGG